MVICADTSFLFSLYGNDVHTPRAIAWLRECQQALTITALGEFELANALRFAEFREAIALGEAVIFWSQFEEDITSGRLRLHLCNLADVMDRAKKISATHTLTSGHRSFDILHIAAALVCGASLFLTFDRNQKSLAKAEGLDVPL